MNKIIIWHLNRDIAIAKGLAKENEHTEVYAAATVHGNISRVRTLWEARCYEPVAVFTPEGDSMEGQCEAAFAVTQHISEPWNREGANRALKPFHQENNRSTSVGDVIEVYRGHTLCVVAVCGRVGWVWLD